MIHVAHVVNDLNGGGMETLVAAMAERFQGTRIAMSAVTLSGRSGRVGAAIRDRLVDFHAIRPVRIVSLLRPIGLARLLREMQVEVVHLHSGSWYKGALAARMAGVRQVIYTEHGREHDDPPLSRWVSKRASQRTDRVVAVSGRLQDYLERVVEVSPDRLLTIPNGIDVERFCPGSSDDLRAELAVPANALVVGSLGRLETVKAYHRLLDAFADVLWRGTVSGPMRLVICGEGSLRSELEARAATLGIGEWTRFPGWVDRPWDFYRMLDVFALVSVSEGASVSLLESMASGVAPVVTDVGASAELLGTEAVGQVVPSGDAAALAGTLEATLRSAERRAQVGGAVRRRAIEEYNLDRMVARYEELYTAG